MRMIFLHIYVGCSGLLVALKYVVLKVYLVLEQFFTLRNYLDVSLFLFTAVPLSTTALSSQTFLLAARPSHTVTTHERFTALLSSDSMDSLIPHTCIPAQQSPEVPCRFSARLGLFCHQNFAEGGRCFSKELRVRRFCAPRSCDSVIIALHSIIDIHVLQTANLHKQSSVHKPCE
jgi:hypothetical protein